MRGKLKEEENRWKKIEKRKRTEKEEKTKKAPIGAN